VQRICERRVRRTNDIVDTDTQRVHLYKSHHRLIHDTSDRLTTAD